MKLRAIHGVGIIGSGCAARRGGRVVDNADVDAHVRSLGGEPMRVSWVEDSGYRSRWWTAAPGGARFADAPTTEDLLVDAATAALDDAGIRPAEVDLLVAATTTPTRMTSAMATAVTGRLGITCAAIDVRAGCPSALHGMAAAYAFLAAGAEVAVVTTAETLSGVAPGTGPLAYALGDAGAAVVLAALDDPRRGLLGGVLGSDGSVSNLVGAPGALPPTGADLAADRYRLIMTREYDDVAGPTWSTTAAAMMASCEVPGTEIGAFVTNQANRRRIREAADAAGVGEDAVVDIVGSTANAGAASFLTALDVARRRDGVADLPWALMGVGGGLSWGGMLIRP